MKENNSFDSLRNFEKFHILFLRVKQNVLWKNL